jgi:hypothetical protein
MRRASISGRRHDSGRIGPVTAIADGVGSSSRRIPDPPTGNQDRSMLNGIQGAVGDRFVGGAGGVDGGGFFTIVQPVYGEVQLSLNERSR